MYDALNVLMAMNIISKEKKEIKWIGLPTNSAQECQNLEVGDFVLQGVASAKHFVSNPNRPVLHATVHMCVNSG